MRFSSIIAATAAILALSACDSAPTSSSDNQIARAQSQATTDLNQRVGQPRIVNGTEMRLMNRIMELRDQPNLATYTYRSDMNGGLHCLGRSIGYGLPYSAQRSNPERVLAGMEYPGSGPGGTIPQAEPNGLFMPDSANATWVIMVSPKGEPQPVYVEDDVTVSPFPLQNVVEQCR